MIKSLSACPAAGGGDRAGKEHLVSGIREQLIGGWRLVSYTETPHGGEASHPLGDNPLGAILYTPDGYMSAQLARQGPYDDDQQPDAYAIAYSGSYAVDEQAATVDHQVQVSVIPAWVGSTQTRQVRFPEQGKLILTTEGSPREGETTTIIWARQPPR
jgi:Lipocalin-like domain